MDNREVKLQQSENLNMTMSSAWFWTTVAVFSISILFLVRKNKNKKLPPGPRGLPIIGHLHLLGKNPHQDLLKLAKEHGPIMRLKFGFVTNIIVSSPHAAEQFLKTYDLVFASRPPHEAAKYISYEQRNLTFAQYGSYWRNMRKLCTLELLSSLKINSFQSLRREELKLMVNSFKQAAKDGVAVDVSAEVSSLSANMSCMMVFGKKYEDKEFDERGFKAVIKEGMQLAATPNLGDYFPYLGKLDLQGLTKRMKGVSKVFDEFFEKILDEHEQNYNQGQANDFTYTMLALMKSGETEFQFDRRHVKAVLLDMLAGSMDTSATVVEWIMSELLRHPRVMKKVQQELEQVVGMARMVEESDLEGLKYLEMVIKEAMRLHPVAPLLVPHEAMEDCTVDGLNIPKKSRIIINAWAIARDPNAWPDPNMFIPERFDGSNIDVRGQNFQLIPFGSGRRGCPGMQLGLTVVRILVAQLMHCFDWELPNKMLPEELDMTEEFGLVVTRAKHLMAIPSYRLRK